MADSNSVKAQIDEMLNLVTNKPTPAEEPPVEVKDTPPAEEVKEEASEPAAEEPAEEAAEEPKEEPEEEPEPEAEPEPEPPAVDELASTKAEVADLKRRLEELISKPPTKETPPEEPPDLRFVSEDADIDDITRDPKEFNKLLNVVYRKSRESTLSEVTKNMPDVIRQNLEVIENVKKASDKFYSDHADLKPFKKVVATVYDEVSKAHSDWDTDRILKEVGSEARKRLDLKGRPAERGDRRTTQPHLPPGSKGAKRSVDKPKVNPLADEIDKMNQVR